MNKYEEAIEYYQKHLIYTMDCCEEDHVKESMALVAIEACEKQIPKKPIRNTNEKISCLICGAHPCKGISYCCVCGQKLDWEVNNNEQNT